MLDLRNFRRRPGEWRDRIIEAPAQDGLATGLVGVPAGSPISCTLSVESVGEGVLVSGTVRAEMAGECARCLAPVRFGVEGTFVELFVDPDSPVRDDEASRLAGDALDVAPLVHDTLLLAAPDRPLCDPDCPGLCPTCGTALAADPAHTHDGPADPRWAALAAAVEPAGGRPAAGGGPARPG